MSHPYLCPSCKTNRTRFAIIDQTPVYVKFDPQSGEIVQQYKEDELEPLHLPYNGSTRRIHCGTCGLTEDEQRFIAMAQYFNKNQPISQPTAQPQVSNPTGQPQAVNPIQQFRALGQPQASNPTSQPQAINPIQQFRALGQPQASNPTGQPQAINPMGQPRVMGQPQGQPREFTPPLKQPTPTYKPISTYNV